MILIDLQQVMISNLMVQIGNHRNAPIDEGMIRHMVLNSLRKYNSKFGDEYGDLILCFDSGNYWRRDRFAYYKANRAKDRKESELDWDLVFTTFQKLKDEFTEFMPYKCILVQKAEADDIIGTLCHSFGEEIMLPDSEKILIVSGDKDFKQLHKYINVDQYSPTLDVFLSEPDPVEYLYQHILKGDSGDGIPNVLSEDNALVTKTRQKPITKKRIEAYRTNRDPEVEKRFLRNQMLIDLNMVPDDIKESVMVQYGQPTSKNRRKMLKYFMENRLRQLTEHLNDF